MNKAAALKVITDMLRERRNELSQRELRLIKFQMGPGSYVQERLEELKMIVPLRKSIADLEAVEQLLLDSTV